MPFEFRDIPIRRFRGAAPLTGEQAVSANPSRRNAINVRKGFRAVLLETAAQDARIALCPKIIGVYWHDVSVGNEGQFNSLLEEGAQGNPAILDSAQTGTITFTLAAADRLYIGFNERAAGAFFDITSTVNNNAQTLTGAYSGAASQFVTTAITDDTESGSAAFAVDNPITFNTVPAEGTWLRRKLSDYLPGGPPEEAFWMQLIPSGLLDAVGIAQLASLTETVTDTTGDSDGIHLDDLREYTIPLHEDVGSIEYWSATGTNATINLTWIHY